MKTYFKNIWLGVYTVLVGMKITLEHLFAKKITNQYPDRWHPLPDKFSGRRSWHKGDEERGDIPPNSRNRLVLDPGLCNGCNGCVRACPVNCITVETIKAVPTMDDVPPLDDGGKRGLWVPKYEIDFAKCCYCALCLPPCPTEAIKMIPDFENSSYSRDELIVQFSNMTPEMIKEKQEIADKFAAEKKKAAAKKAAEAAAKKAAEAKAAAEAAPKEEEKKETEPEEKKETKSEEKPENNNEGQE